MSVRSFRPVAAVATVVAAALSCYLVSLRVAAERAGLEDLETRIVLAQRDIRSLQTEIGTRGRLEQLERWNVKVLALSAPKADQFVDGGYQLARLARPSEPVSIGTPVVLASAPKPVAAPRIADDEAGAARAMPTQAGKASGSPASLMHIASYTPPDTRSTALNPIAGRDAITRKHPIKAPENVSATTKPLKIATSAAKPILSVAATKANASLAPRTTKTQTSGATTFREKATH